MKKTFLKIIPSVLLATMAVCLLSSCEKDDENTEEQSVQKGPIWFSDKSLEFSLVACERVGKALVIDFTVTNQSKNTISGLEIFGDYNTEVYLSPLGYNSRMKDNLGEEYWNGIHLAIGKTYREYSGKIGTLAPGESRLCHLLLSEFGLENKATSVSQDWLVKGGTQFKDCFGRNDGIGILRFINVPIVDKRPTTGVMTADRQISFKYTKFQRNDEGNLEMTFTVTNNSDEPLHRFLMNCRGGCFDDLGNDYGLGWTSKNESRWGLSVEGSEYGGYQYMDIEAGQSANGRIIIREPAEGATRFDCYFETSTESRLLEDDMTRFVNI